MSSQELSIPISPSITLHTLVSTPAQPSSRPSLLLLHFWGGSHHTYHPSISLLQDHYQIIAPSLRGWGMSSAPVDVTAYRIVDYVADIVALLLHLNTQQLALSANGVIVVGHSMGGKLAQVLLNNVEVASLVRGLILIAPAPAGSFALSENMRAQQIHAYDSVESASFVVENVLLGEAENVTEATRVDLAKGMVAGSPGARAAWPEYGMAEDYERAVVGSVERYQREQGVLKVLIIAGELDRVEEPGNVESRVAVVLRNSGADVKIEQIAGVGHLIPLEAPESMAAAVTAFVESL
ncbi:alpha/beta-hydrolase [Mytilinidion resinicola]|uniref:Alpha/beta-hydrolase n=1 Tax=Mytilinidion resinicola TaxID=574789 RepID=A0A6A6XXY4_9PEZI|nr:alpha/beta-hydrolase [Mytilinidion resinicola]KAF2801290.1 alpha/beta-hydrolase [Mytilinidion resinicola]